MRRTLLCAESAGFWHIGVRMMLVEELNGMESAAVDVEVDIKGDMQEADVVHSLYPPICLKPKSR